MFQTLSLLCSQEPRFKRVSSVLSQILFHPRKIQFSSEASIENPNYPSSSNINQTRKDLTSLKFSGIAKCVVSRCSHTWGTNKAETSDSISIKDYFLRLSDINPQVVRGFWRVSVLKPRDVLEILLGFESDVGKHEVELIKVESLWGIFNWASQQASGFDHIPQSCKIMASMLVRVGLYSEVECLLSRRESQGILLDCEEIFSDLIKGYLGEFELDRAMSVYERMRKLALAPSISSYQALVEYLIELNESQLVHHVYLDMINNGMRGGIEEMSIHENVIRLLCMDGKVQEARYLIKDAADHGTKLSNLVVNAIICGYCEKKDYNDILSFLAEFKIVPDVILGNKILFSLCRNYGVEQVSMFLQILEQLGFCLDGITLGILIGFSCREGKLKNAFVYISNILSRGLKPNVYSYNALLSGMFKEEMWMLCRDILLEMNDIGVTPNLSTFKILLAGFCKFRQFDEVKAIVSEMADHKLVSLSSVEDPLTKGFILLGLDPLVVKIRRDNDRGLSKAEFFDNLGNGLYLDTDVDEYERKISEILDDGMMPNFNSSIVEISHSRDMKKILSMVDEMTKWGQDISLPALSALFTRLSRTQFGIETINRYLGVLMKSTYELDQSTLNMLIQIYSKKGLTFKARTLFDGMARKGYTIDNASYSALLLDICKKGDLRSFCYFLKVARKSNWSPNGNDFKYLFGNMCKQNWFCEAFELFETVLSVGRHDLFNNFDFLVKELCSQGVTSTAQIFFEELSNKDMILDSHTVYGHLVSGFCDEKRYKEAFQILEIMIPQKLSVPVYVFSQLIPHLCRNYEIEKALELRNIVMRDQSSELLPVNCALISGFLKAGRIQEAVNLFKEVLLLGLSPNTEVFNALIEGYCGGNSFNKVREVLAVMIRKSIRISISSYSKMARVTCREGKLSLAMSLKELMLLPNNNFPEIVLYNIIIFHISSLRNSSLLDEIISTLQKKSLHFDDVTYNYLIRGFLLCNNISRSLQFLETMIGQDIRPSNRSIREVITRLSRNQELFWSLSQEIEKRGFLHGSVVQNNIVEALMDCGKLEEAVQFLDRIVSKNQIPDKIEYDYLIKHFYQYGRVDKSVELLNTMLRKGSHPNPASYDHIIQGFCRGNKLDGALDFHTEMMCRNLKPSMMTWDILVCSLCENGRVEEAEKLLKWMIGLGEVPSKEGFNAVINRYKAEKNAGKTAEIVKVMQEKGYVPDFDTHWSVISNLSNSCKKDEEKSSFLSSLLSGFRFGRNQGSR